MSWGEHLVVAVKLNMEYPQYGIYIYIYIYIYIHIYVYVYVCICMYIYMYIYIWYWQKKVSFKICSFKFVYKPMNYRNQSKSLKLRWSTETIVVTVLTEVIYNLLNFPFLVAHSTNPKWVTSRVMFVGQVELIHLYLGWTNLLNGMSHQVY